MNICVFNEFTNKQYLPRTPTWM